MSSTALDGLKRPGWLTFAAVVLISFGCLRVISAIYYFADSNRVNNLTFGAFGHHLFLWGLWDLLIAVLAIWGGYSLLSGNTFGRVIGYIWGGVVLIQSFMILGYAPWFGIASLALSMLVMYGIAVTSDWHDASTSTA
jgi:hypothetical protein